MSEAVQRLDRYVILVDGERIVATPQQERIVRGMTPEQRKMFVKVMRGGR